MRVLYVADGRSPIARSWIQGMLSLGIEAHLATTYRCDPLLGLRSIEHVPVAFSRLKSDREEGSSGASGIGWRSAARHWLGPLTVPGAARRLRSLIPRVKPDLVHALRIPFEGMLATWSSLELPVVVSSWGNDFTLHAPATPVMAWLTRRAVVQADGLHADCQRDLRLARQWGLAEETPAVVLPGNGGLDPVFFGEGENGPRDSDLERHLAEWQVGDELVVNPRGFRAYVRNDTFFQSIPHVLRQRPSVHFVCPAMAGDPLAHDWLERLAIEEAVTLLGQLAPADMARLFRRAQVAVSPSEHDGTPNSLLEAMACGAFPIAGDLESLREWVRDGENGLLFDPADPLALADSILRALESEALRRKADEHNRRLVVRRARRQDVGQGALDFYREVLGWS